MTPPAKNKPILPTAVLSALGERNVVFVGLMGAGKTAIGRKVASRLGLPFADSDHEIEQAARMSIPDIFERYGEPEFRALEERVMHRLLKDGGRVVSTGGGAFINPVVREAITRGSVSIWLKADIDTLMERVAKRKDRPLLRTPDPRAVMQKLISERYPVYAKANLTVPTRAAHRDVIAAEVIEALGTFLTESTPSEASAP